MKKPKAEVEIKRKNIKGHYYFILYENGKRQQRRKVRSGEPKSALQDRYVKTRSITPGIERSKYTNFVLTTDFRDKPRAIAGKGKVLYGRQEPTGAGFQGVCVISGKDRNGKPIEIVGRSQKYNSPSKKHEAITEAQDNAYLRYANAYRGEDGSQGNVKDAKRIVENTKAKQRTGIEHYKAR